MAGRYPALWHGAPSGIGRKAQGRGKAVLDWSMEHCQSLRADTHADNKIMQHLLEKNGFTRCGVIHVADGSPRFAYQKLAPIQPLG